MSITVTFGNAKGGVGKTTNSCMIAYMLAKKGYKTLVADIDPQANATSLLLKTAQRINKEIVQFDKTLMAAISENNLESIITPVVDNLYLLPSFADFVSFPIYLEETYDDKSEKITHLKNTFAKFENDYDFIIIDTPPTISLYTDNALIASDQVVIVMQTQERSFDGAVGYIVYLNQLIERYGADYDIIGILPVLLKNTSKVDQNILDRALEEFGTNNIFNNVIKNMERLKRYDVIGISDPDLVTDSDFHDKTVFDVYEGIADEFLERLGMEKEVVSEDGI